MVWQWKTATGTTVLMLALLEWAWWKRTLQQLHGDLACPFCIRYTVLCLALSPGEHNVWFTLWFWREFCSSVYLLEWASHMQPHRKAEYMRQTGYLFALDCFFSLYLPSKGFKGLINFYLFEDCLELFPTLRWDCNFKRDRFKTISVRQEGKARDAYSIVKDDNNCWTRLSKVSWFAVVSRSIIYRSWRLRQTIISARHWQIMIFCNKFVFTWKSLSDSSGKRAIIFHPKTRLQLRTSRILFAAKPT